MLVLAEGDCSLQPAACSTYRPGYWFCGAVNVALNESRACVPEGVRLLRVLVVVLVVLVVTVLVVVSWVSNTWSVDRGRVKQSVGQSVRQTGRTLLAELIIPWPTHGHGVRSYRQTRHDNVSPIAAIPCCPRPCCPPQ